MSVYLLIFVAYYVWLSVRYFLVAGLTFAWFKSKKNAYQKVSAKQIKREIKYSMISFIVFSIVGAAMIYAMEHNMTTLYLKVSDHSLLYIPFSVLMMLLVHDIYFYVTHRLMHEVKWLQKYHRVHHQSVETTPWSSFSFHPIEALIETGAGIILLFIFPVHPIAFIIFQLIMVGFNIIGHLGFDLFPNSSRWISTGRVHSQHHKNSKVNFGLYTTFWDWLFKTSSINDSVSVIPRNSFLPQSFYNRPVTTAPEWVETKVKL